MKNYGKIFISLLVILLLIFFTATVYASSDTFQTETAVNTVKDYHSKADMKLIPNTAQEVDLIYVWYVALHDYGDGLVGVEGSTEAHFKVEEIRVKIELQKKIGSSWKTVKTWSDVQFFKDEAYCFKSATVDRGYEYRVKGTHYAEDGSLMETQTSCTSPYFID
ncbi:MAG: DUF6147 family protein [Bacteroidales bacterium]|jgi:hypothetical protein